MLQISLIRGDHGTATNFHVDMTRATDMLAEMVKSIGQTPSAHAYQRQLVKQQCMVTQTLWWLTQSAKQHILLNDAPTIYSFQKVTKAHNWEDKNVGNRNTN